MRGVTRCLLSLFALVLTSQFVTARIRTNRPTLLQQPVNWLTYPEFRTA
jgi:hypothetical protein